MKIKWCFLGLIAAVVATASCDSNGQETGSGTYIIEVSLETFEAKRSTLKNAVGKERIERDTVGASSALNAFSKGVQKYAAVLLDIHRQGEETRAGSGELIVLDEQGENIINRLSQIQRDSVMMNFIHFARGATIPYYEHVKDFELKVMAVR